MTRKRNPGIEAELRTLQRFIGPEMEKEVSRWSPRALASLPRYMELLVRSRHMKEAKDLLAPLRAAISHARYADPRIMDLLAAWQYYYAARYGGQEGLKAWVDLFLPYPYWWEDETQMRQRIGQDQYEKHLSFVGNLSPGQRLEVYAAYVLSLLIKQQWLAAAEQYDLVTYLADSGVDPLFLRIEALYVDEAWEAYLAYLRSEAEQALCITEVEAAEVVSLMIDRSAGPRNRLARINKIVRGYGVEPNHPEPPFRTYGGDYVNMGDTYATTVLYDEERDRMLLMTWGDWLEDYEHRHGLDREEQEQE